MLLVVIKHLRERRAVSKTKISVPISSFGWMGKKLKSAYWYWPWTNLQKGQIIMVGFTDFSPFRTEIWFHFNRSNKRGSLNKTSSIYMKLAYFHLSSTLPHVHVTKHLTGPLESIHFHLTVYMVYKIRRRRYILRWKMWKNSFFLRRQTVCQISHPAAWSHSNILMR